MSRGGWMSWKRFLKPKARLPFIIYNTFFITVLCRWSILPWPHYRSQSERANETKRGVRRKDGEKELMIEQKGRGIPPCDSPPSNLTPFHLPREMGLKKTYRPSVATTTEGWRKKARRGWGRWENQVKKKECSRKKQTNRRNRKSGLTKVGCHAHCLADQPGIDIEVG